MLLEQRRNPTGGEGQLVGGVAKGIGQASYEEAVSFDNGTLLAGALQDFAIPKADKMPPMETDSTSIPSPNNSPGAKGVEESGTIGAAPAIVTGVVDALEPFEITHIDMPVRAEKIWQATRNLPFIPTVTENAVITHPVR